MSTTSGNTTASSTTLEDDLDTLDNSNVGVFIIFILILLVVLGIIAMIWSLICFGRSGTIFEKFIGVVIAFFVGPFYFIYYFANKNYCR